MDQVLAVFDTVISGPDNDCTPVLVKEWKRLRDYGGLVPLLSVLQNLQSIGAPDVISRASFCHELLSIFPELSVLLEKLGGTEKPRPDSGEIQRQWQRYIKPWASWVAQCQFRITLFAFQA